MLNQQAPYIILLLATIAILYNRLTDENHDPGFSQFFVIILLPLILSATILSRHYGLLIGLLVLIWPCLLVPTEKLTGIRLTQNLVWIVALIYIIFFYSLYLSL